MASNPAPEPHKPLRGEKEYRDFFIQTLGAASLCLAMLICFLASLPSDLAEELAFTPDEVLEISEPAARLMAKAKLPEKTRQVIVSSGDYVGLGVALTAYVYRIMAAVKERTENGVIHPKATAVQTAQRTNSGDSPASTNGIAHLAGFGSFAIQ